MSHTPGPWYVHYPDGDASGYEIVAAGIEPALAAVYDEDNAHLLASAPDLLEACREALRTFEREEEIPAPRSLLREAIAKAAAMSHTPGQS